MTHWPLGGAVAFVSGCVVEQVMGKVLIVDEERTIGDYLANLITRLGHQVEVTLNASDTLAKLDEGGFQLVIADIRLPDAPDAQAWVTRLCRKAKDIPVVLISGAPSAELDACAKANGALAFLSKPFELAFIKNILQNVFQNNPETVTCNVPEKETNHGHRQNQVRARVLR